MLILNNVYLSLDYNFEDMIPAAEKELRVKREAIKSARLFKKSVDARHKDNVRFCCSLIVELNCNEKSLLSKCKKAQIYNEKKYIFPTAMGLDSKARPVVIGFGPAGMFAALTLAQAGLEPIVYERGYDIETRTKDVQKFFETGVLNTESNIQFGEGGAGTFSDGKLNTGIRDIRCRAVIECFNHFGAPDSILTDAKPHIGTDILAVVVKNIRSEITALGGSVNFGCRFDGIKTENGSLKFIYINGREIPCENLILAIGHSARDTFAMLRDSGIEMIKKPFSVGVRIEHLQSNINKALYGKFADHPALGAADYKLAAHLENGRGVYTFCMCPGGEVVNSSSETGGTVVNGMSNSRRDGKNANSALLVGIEPDDIQDGDVLAGCNFQRKIEKAAYELARGGVPYTTVNEFVFGKENPEEKVLPTVKPFAVKADISGIFPDFVTESLKQGILEFDKKIKGFADGSAVLTAPETRSSSPVRILRGENNESVNINGIFPCGEGAGYAGGIVSAAVDGIKCAESLIAEKYTDI